MKTPQPENGPDTFAMLGNIMELFNQVVESGAPLEPDIVAALGAASLDSADSYAREMVTARVEPFLALNRLVPQPWGPPPARGEVDGPYRVAHIDGQPENLFGLEDEDILLNILVFGEQGFGKTTFIKALLISLMEQSDG